MPVELYMKPGFGRRLRKITRAAAASLAKINNSFFSSVTGYGQAPSAVAPAKTSDPSIAGAAGATTVGTTFTCTPGVYTGTPTPAVTRQWKRGGVNIAGETNLTFDSTGSTAADSITCVETATNASGTVTGTSNAVVLT